MPCDKTSQHKCLGEMCEEQVKTERIFDVYLVQFKIFHIQFGANNKTHDD